MTEREKKNIKMSKRQLELSEHTAYDAYKHIQHIRQIEIKTTLTVVDDEKSNELNRKTKRFNFFIWPVCSSVGIVLLRDEHTAQNPGLCVSSFLVENYFIPKNNDSNKNNKKK